MAIPLTVLALTAIGVPPYSARGLTQSLNAIQQAAQLKRTINGALKDLSEEQFHKYASTITGDDQQPPAVDGVWPGLQVTIDCIAELSYKTAGGSPQRTVVAGSSRTEGDFTFYRPQLTMLITDFKIERDEYGAQVQWSMSLEEV